MVDIVFIVYGGMDLIRRALNSLRENTPPDFLGNVVVVDNLCPDPEEDVSGYLFPQREVHLLSLNRNLSYAASCNLGFEYSMIVGGASAVCFCNSDIVFSPGWIPPLWKCCSLGSPVAGPKLISPGGEIMGAGCVDSFTVPRGWREEDQGQWDRVDSVSSVSGACMLVNTSWFGEVGGFDLGYPFYWEDADLCTLAVVQGLEVVYCGESTIYHIRGGSCRDRDRERLARDMEYGRERFLEKWGEHPEIVRKV